MEKKKAFTLIELMVVVAIIGILSVFFLSGWAVSTQRKAAINSYKTTMQSVRTAMEFCIGTGETVSSPGGSPGDVICTGTVKYPPIEDRCGAAPYFLVQPVGNWQFTTTTDSSGSSGWDCKGCRLVCDVLGCTEIGDCNS